MSETLIFIPARSGSKRIKNKNVKKINGKPLIYWTIKYAKKYVKNSEDIVVSSDSNYIHKISIKEKVKFFKRPKNISGDKAEVYFAVVHALKRIKDSKKYKYIALLQPTSPIRPKNMILNGIKTLKKNKYFQNLIHLEKTYYKVGSLSKKNEWEPLYEYTIRGQDINNQFRPSGCLFLYLRKDFENYKKFIKRKNYGYIQKEKIETVNIDNEEDFVKLRFLLKTGKNLY
ncbi:acylneuraminate cytidylyltransferase family protein [Candidatus Pelagibacter sp.]|nr:acylneuraminate cytidylyltransferase family protein [Candidatus Pelagibacter sp.]